MTTTINLICFKCKHFREIEGGCDAFPDDIPDEILTTNKHDKPLKEQKNKIVFEPIKKKQ
jgi:hypothetical protein